MGIFDRIEEYLIGARNVYWFLAIFGTCVFFIQILLSFLGFGSDSDMDVDGDGNFEFGEHSDTGFSEFRFFSLRAVFAFITFFGWGGVLWGDNGWPGFIAALVCGLVMMFATAFVVFALIRLQHSGNISSSDIIGKSGTVYLSVPPGRIETGKVTVSVNNSTREIIAVADEELPTGTSVTVEKQVDARRYLVKKVQ